MSTKLILAVAFVIGAVVYSYHDVPAQSLLLPEPYNVILIIADDVGVDLVNAYAEHYYDAPSEWEPCTPNLDALARDGIRFTNAWSSSSCSPSRAMIMTGMLPSKSGVGTVVNDEEGLRGLDESIMTLGAFGELTGGEGAFFGKWHLADPSQWPSQPTDLGFDHFEGTKIGSNYKSHTEWTGVDCEKNVVDDYSTEHITNDATAYIGTMPQEPWLLTVSYHAVHSPFHCPAHQNYDGDCGPACPTGHCATCIQTGPNKSTASEKARAMMQSLDHYIKQIMDAADDNTFIIFVGDNGTPQEATEAPWDSARAKRTVYQGGINVPLIIRPPASFGYVDMNTTENELVSITDIFATVADLLGLEPEDLEDENLEHSQSFRRIWDSDAWSSEARGHVFTERFRPNFRRENGSRPVGHLVSETSGHSRAIRNHRFKLIEEYTSDGWIQRRMYSLHRPGSMEQVPHDPAILDDEPGADPKHSAFELVDVYNDPLYAADRVELSDLLFNNYGSIFESADWEVQVIVNPTELKTASQVTPTGGGPVAYECSGGSPFDIKVGYGQTQVETSVHRTFMKFDLSDVEGDVHEAFLDVEVKLGATDVINVEVWDAPMDVSNVSDCEILWGNFGGPGPHYTAAGWDLCTTNLVTFSMADVIPDIQDAIDQNGSISIALKGMVDVEDSFATLTNTLDRHKLRLTTTLSGGGPACPYVYVFDGEDFVEANTILEGVDAQNAGRPSANVTDTYILQTAPAAVDGRYQIEIREFENEHSFIDRVSLYEVDHPEDTEMAVTDGGELIVYKEQMLPTTARDARGRDLLETMSREDGVMFHGKAGDELVLTYAASKSRDVGIMSFAEEKNNQPPLPSADGEITAGIEAFVRLPGGDQFESLGAFMPRERQAPAPLLIPSGTVQPGDELVLRLKWHTDHALDHAGLFVRMPVEVEPRELERVVASHSTGAIVESKVASGDGDFAELVPGEALSLSFKAAQEPVAGRRSFFLVVEGHYFKVPQGQQTENALPRTLQLHANSPNPFNPTTMIRFDLPQPGQVSIRIHNVSGELVRTVANRQFAAGRHGVEWNGTNERGGQVSSGVYFYTLESDLGRMSRRMLLLK